MQSPKSSTIVAHSTGTMERERDTISTLEPVMQHEAGLEVASPMHYPAVWAPAPGITDEKGNPIGSKAGPLRSRFNLIMLFLAIAAVILAAVLGGVLGSQLSSCRSASPAVSPTPEQPPAQEDPASPTDSTAIASPTPTLGVISNYAVASPGQVRSLFMDCPNMHRQIVPGNFSTSFLVDCFVDYTGPALENDDTISAIAVVTAFSPIECFNACAALNRKSELEKRQLQCRSVTFHKDMADMWAVHGGNCWLKNATMASADQGRRYSMILSAKIV